MTIIWAVARQKQQNDLCAQRRLCTQLVAKSTRFYWDSEDWLDWANAKADLCLRFAHKSFCWFCHAAAHILDEVPSLWCAFLHYSPGIYAEAYTVYVFSFIRSYVRLFVLPSCSWNYFKVLRATKKKSKSFAAYIHVHVMLLLFWWYWKFFK